MHKSFLLVKRDLAEIITRKLHPVRGGYSLFSDFTGSLLAALKD
jgi:hypothetical protein